MKTWGMERNVQLFTGLNATVFFQCAFNFLGILMATIKLFCGRIVINEVINGYSRKIVFLKCSNNNRANTVVIAFHEAVQKNCLPPRVRSDMGREMLTWQDLC